MGVALGRPSDALDQLEPRLKNLRGEHRFRELERRMAFP